MTITGVSICSIPSKTHNFTLNAFGDDDRPDSWQTRVVFATVQRGKS